MAENDRDRSARTGGGSATNGSHGAGPVDPLDEPAPVPHQRHRVIDRGGRDRKGRYTAGVSGNRKGRPVTFPRDPKLPASRRRVLNDIADTIIEVKIDGKPQKMTLFEANVRALAVAGAKGDRIAAQKYIDLMLELADVDLQRRLSSMAFIERMNAIEAENEQLRQIAAPRSGVVRVPIASLDDWDPHARLDDEPRVAMIRESLRIPVGDEDHDAGQKG